MMIIVAKHVVIFLPALLFVTSHSMCLLLCQLWFPQCQRCKQLPEYYELVHKASTIFYFKE